MEYEVMSERRPTIIKWRDLKDDTVAIPPARWIDTKVETFKYKGKNCEATNFIFEALDDGVRYKASNAFLKYILENDFVLGECVTVKFIEMETMEDGGTRPKIEVLPVKVIGETATESKTYVESTPTVETTAEVNVTAADLARVAETKTGETDSLDNLMG